MNAKNDKTVLTVSNVSITLTNKHESRILVKNLNLKIKAGEMIGLAGESGSGKSMTAAAILGLLPPSARISKGSILFSGNELTAMKEKEMQKIRGKDVTYIFQNYQGSFTPFLKIGRQLVEAIKSHRQVRKANAEQEVLYWLERVKLPAERTFNSYPHQLSGGQLQRAALAASLMMKPSLIIADEPTTALDVLTGESILQLLADLQREIDCAVLLISHNLNHLLKRTDKMMIMYGGSIVEHGPTEMIATDPAHPYTKLLLSTQPKLEGSVPRRLPSIDGEPGLTAETGCPFALRCPLVMPECRTFPAFQEKNVHHWSACHADMRGEKTDADSQPNLKVLQRS
ncbi:ABC transporter ATP-binding protein [Metabacillus indicus]|uniref:ABC transporter ATP-binding protein n=1 Tax=Metabacillus indicus TaxID=246786 RepID=UPI00068D8132|nr:ABC transporter ATP-binding protein [Metabacillus indicus]